MIPVDQCAALLLCAGLSTRFGRDNKLLAPLAGKPLVAHAAGLCRRLPFAARIAVVPPGDERLRRLLRGFGFETVENPNPAEGKELSLRLGLAWALDRRVRGVLVLLGDMPHVGETHLGSLFAAASDERAAISRAGEIRSPPTLIPQSLARLALDRPDRRVRAMVGEAEEVSAPAGELADYDRAEDFVSPRRGI